MRVRDHSLILLFTTLCLAAAVSGCDPEGDSPAESDSQKPAQNDVPSVALRTPRKPHGQVPAFRTLGVDAGLHFERYDDFRGQRRLIEVNGGGVAVFDFDRDGWLDVFYTNGCPVPVDPGDTRYHSELFRSGGGRQFRSETRSSRLLLHGFATGCAVGDYDSDGFDDLYVTAFGRNSLWKNHGDGTFSNVSSEIENAVPDWSTSAAFADLNGDGHLDLYIVNYVDESADEPRLCPHSGSPDGFVACSPEKFEGVPDVLLLSDAGGRFMDASSPSGIGSFAGKGLGVAVTDLDHDLQPEIYVANDGQANFLFTVSGESRADRADGAAIRFEERALRAGVALNEYGYAQAGMGIAAGDYDSNGTIDLFLTHFYDDTNTLYANQGDLLLVDATRSSQLAGPSRRTLGFGTVFIDADNDGWLDLFVANGHVDERTWMENPEPYAMPPQMFRNEQDSKFADVSLWSGSYFRQSWVGRGVAAGDLNRDGLPDLVVSHQRAVSAALQNETTTRNASIVVRLVGTVSNRNGYGTRLEADVSGKTLVRELTAGGSYQSASATDIHVGLGAAHSAGIGLRWPSGAVDRHEAVTPGEWVAIEGGPLIAVGRPASSE